MSIILLIIGLILFVTLVIVHELGHFWAARRNGVEVEEFGIGFPPTAWKRKTKRGFDFSPNWLPVGGFVKLKGENDSDKRPGSFGAASTLAKAKIMMAGIGINLAVAYVMFVVLAWVGMPQILDNQFNVATDTKVTQNQVFIGYIEPDSPAARSGLDVRDRLVSVSAPGVQARAVQTAEQLPGITKQFAGKRATVAYERKGQQRTANVDFRSSQEVESSKNTDNPKGYLGVAPVEFTLKQATWSAPVVAGGLMWQLTVATFQGLGQAIGALFQGNGSQAANAVAGPVGIVVVLKDGSAMGYHFMLFIIAIISLSLAIMNVLPIPALDGGRLYLMLFSRLIKKPLSKELEERVVGASFVFLLMLLAVITVVDVRRFIL